MKTAILGLPMTGKTSLFTILTGVHETGRTGSMETRVGVTKVPDHRLDALAARGRQRRGGAFPPSDDGAGRAVQRGGATACRASRVPSTPAAASSTKRPTCHSARVRRCSCRASL